MWIYWNLFEKIREITSSELKSGGFYLFETTVRLCSSDHELVGHDHGSENNAADWDGYDTMIQLQEKLGFNLSEIGCLLDFVRDNYRWQIYKLRRGRQIDQTLMLFQNKTWKEKVRHASS